MRSGSDERVSWAGRGAQIGNARGTASHLRGLYAVKARTASSRFWPDLSTKVWAVSQPTWSQPPSYGSAPYGPGQHGQAPPGAPQYGAPQYGAPQYGPPQYGPPQGGYRSGPGFGGQPGGFGQAGFGGGVAGYGPGPHAPAPRRRSPLRLVLLGIIALAVIALAGLVATGLVNEPRGSAYQNDDYQVPPPDLTPPPLPAPETFDEAEALLTANPVYGQAVPAPVRCTSQPINVVDASDEQLKAHFEGLMECLVRVWQPPLTGANFEIVRPTVTIYGREITTRCGNTEINAFYCALDQQIYYSNLLARAIPTIEENKWSADVVMAHEFGHLLQGRLGILISRNALAQQAGTEGEVLLIVRRTETQADCFSAMFMRSVSRSLGVQQADVDGILATYAAVGDDTLSQDPNIVGNHGLARSRVYWGTLGLGTPDVGKCNSFSADPDLVR